MDASPNIVERVNRREPGALAELRRVYDARVLATCRRILRCREDAEDAAAEVWVRIARYAGRLPTADGLKLDGYIITVARNVCFSVRRRQALAEGSALAPVEGVVDEQNDDADAIVRRVDARRTVEQALPKVAADVRETIVAVELMGLSYGESAVLLEIPVGTVKSRLFRGKAALRAVLDGAVGLDVA